MGTKGKRKAGSFEQNYRTTCACTLCVCVCAHEEKSAAPCLSSEEEENKEEDSDDDAYMPSHMHNTYTRQRNKIKSLRA